MKPTFLIILFTLFSSLSFGQGEANIWYFGHEAGLNFNFNPPLVLSNSVMSTPEGCASISDSSGNLLFYTDGVKVWNKNHTIMDNGIGLNGNSSSTQSAVIIKHPAFNYYHILTIDGFTGGEKGLYYSTVDMNLNSELGKVVKKNEIIQGNTSEKIAVVSHANGVDMWIITREMRTNNYLVFLLNENGISNAPIISKVGEIPNDNYPGVGYLKASFNTKYIVNAEQTQGLEIFRFDNLTGILSDPIKISDKSFYGVEFSSSSKLLYASLLGTPELYQYDISKYEKDSIKDSELLLGKLNKGGAIQMAPNGKIYVSDRHNRNLSIIHEPDNKGYSCNYEIEGLNLGKGATTYGLPTFFNNYLSQFFKYSYISVCLGDKISLCIPPIEVNKIDSLFWNFGDGYNKTYYEVNSRCVEHNYKLKGEYKAEAIIYSVDYVDTISLTIQVRGIDNYPTWTDTSIFRGSPILLDLSKLTLDSIRWFDGDTSFSHSFTEAGKYSYRMSKEGCHKWDVIDIKNQSEIGFFIPSTFTPNGDGLNDVYNPIAGGYIQIFNRWGEQLYEGYEGWDGSYKSAPALTGMYIYVITDKVNNTKYKGTVYLLR